MSHDAWASFSTIELARDCMQQPQHWFAAAPPWPYQTFAVRDPSSGWPYPDGALELERTQGPAQQHVFAVEFKRVNEGLHGILTGLGQAQAYLRKGFPASVLVLPESYDTHPDPGAYAASVLDHVAPNAPVAVFTYRDPDLGSVSPFANRLTCRRGAGFDINAPPAPPGLVAVQGGRSSTQWAQVREGSTTPDVLFKYLQSSREVVGRTPSPPVIRAELRRAVAHFRRRGRPQDDPANYLSDTTGGPAFKDVVRRHFWFSHVLTANVQRLFQRQGNSFIPDTSPTLLLQWDGSPMVFFGARADSIKQRLAGELTAGTTVEADAWVAFARNIKRRAHSFCVDVEAGLRAIGFIDADGRMTPLGFRFLSSCERAGGANNPQPRAILRWALLTHGDFLALLHYVHAISDEVFRRNEFSFVDRTATRPRFNSRAYRDHLIDELAGTLRVAATSARRPGRRRPPLEGEFITLRKLDLVQGFRPGVGLEINWAAVHGALEAGEGW